jgi:hypothetical protein
MLKSPSNQPVMQMEITASEGTILGPVGWGQLALSPDGRRLAFVATGGDGRRRLFLRSLDSSDAVPLAGTENVGLVPAWSPDSRWLGFDANGRFQKIDVIAGGPPQTICECFAGAASWNPQGTILVAMRNQPLHGFLASGARRPLAADTARGEVAGRSNFLPGGKEFVYDSTATEEGAVRHLWIRQTALPGRVPIAWVCSPHPRKRRWLLYRRRWRTLLGPQRAQDSSPVSA